jgi:hypothetical protein
MMYGMPFGIFVEGTGAVLYLLMRELRRWNGLVEAGRHYNDRGPAGGSRGASQQVEATPDGFMHP